MSMFATLAPRYWDAGYSAIPLIKGTKKPAISKWTGYCNNLPSDETRCGWVATYPDAGIGLPLGREVWPGWCIAAIDIDVDALSRLPEAIIGNAPCKKRGKKGVTIFVKIRIGSKIKSGKIGKEADEPAGDMLFNAKYTVLPPSIHPDTGSSYEWIDKELLECKFEDFPELELKHLVWLNLVAEFPETQVLVRGQVTHEAARDLVWKLTRAGCDEGTNERIIHSLLPIGYAGDTLKELAGLISSAKEKLGNFAEDDDGDTIAAKVVRLALGSGLEFFKDGDRAYASIPQSGGGVLTYPVMSSDFGRWLRKNYHEQFRKPLARASLSDAVATLEAIALFQGQSHPVFIRVGADPLDGGIAVDLGRPEGELVKISPDGWSLSAAREPRFYRASGFEELPTPLPGGDLRILQEIFNLSDHAFMGTCAFLLNALRPEGPYFCLLVEGPQGSGKSLLCSAIKSLIDPNQATRQRLPDNERDLMIHAKQYHLLVYDNASGMKQAISDALCTLATGGGLGVRKLYSDDELQVFNYSKPFIINGISGYARGMDLLERSIFIRLEAMPDEKRRTEEEVMGALLAARPQILGALYEAASIALRRLPGIAAPDGVRMADAGRWIAAAETALGFPEGALVGSIRDAQDELFVERVNEEPLLIQLREKVVREEQFEGYVSELFDKLFPEGPRREPGMPRTPAHLSGLLARLAPAMKRAGLFVEFLSKDKRGRKVRICQREYLPPLPRSQPPGGRF